jgi:hypothetical protein
MTAAPQNGRLVIHMGVQKTGSTAFHHFVNQNREVLDPYLQVLTPAKASPTRAAGRMAGLFSLDPTLEPDFTSALRDLQEYVLNKPGNYLISHENLPGAMLGRDGVVTLYPQLEKLLAILDREFAPLQPSYVFYTRSMARWKKSVHNQAVKSDRYKATLETFLQETANCGSWDALKSRVEGAVGAARCAFFALEDEADAERPGRQLLRHCGVPQAVIETMEPVRGARNPSLSAGALEFLRLVNELDLPRSARRPVAQLVRENPALFASPTEVPS